MDQQAEVDQLLSRSRLGDKSAFTQLFRLHRTSVMRIVYRMNGHGADSEDLIQEVFIQVYRSLGEFRGQAKFSTWLHRVTVNVILMARRAAKSRPQFATELPNDIEVSNGDMPETELLRAERIQAFRRVLDRLGDKKRAVFMLHELEGMTPSQIAEVVSAPVLTVRTRLFYARREVAEMMREEPSLAQLAEELAADHVVRRPESEKQAGSEAR